MRTRLLLSFTAVLALAGCNDAPTPKPALPSSVTTPITQPARPDLTLGQPALACPPQPVPICPPAAAAQHVVAGAVARPHRVKKIKAVHHTQARQAHAHRGHAAQGRRHHYAGGYTGGYVEGGQGETGAYESYRYDSPRSGPAEPEDTVHIHAYGHDGAVAHYAAPRGHQAQARDERHESQGYRSEDRYSGGGQSWSREERRSERYEGAGATMGGHAARSGSTYSESYSETRSEQSSGGAYHHGGVVRTASGGCECGGAASRDVAGRDDSGFLTWAGKVPARP